MAKMRQVDDTLFLPKEKDPDDLQGGDGVPSPIVNVPPAGESAPTPIAQATFNQEEPARSEEKPRERAQQPPTPVAGLGGVEAPKPSVSPLPSSVMGDVQQRSVIAPPQPSEPSPAGLEPPKVFAPLPAPSPADLIAPQSTFGVNVPEAPAIPGVPETTIPSVPQARSSPALFPSAKKGPSMFGQGRGLTGGGIGLPGAGAGGEQDISSLLLSLLQLLGK